MIVEKRNEIINPNGDGKRKKQQQQQ